MPDETSEAPAKKTSSRGGRKYTKAQAMVASRALGDCSPHVMAAALYDKSDDEELSEAEIKAAVKALREPKEA